MEPEVKRQGHRRSDCSLLITNDLTGVNTQRLYLCALLLFMSRDVLALPVRSKRMQVILGVLVVNKWIEFDSHDCYQLSVVPLSSFGLLLTWFLWTLQSCLIFLSSISNKNVWNNRKRSYLCHVSGRAA